MRNGSGARARAERRTLFEGLPDPAPPTDSTGHIAEVNDAACLMLGGATEDSVGRPRSLLAPENYAGMVQEMVRQAVLMGQARQRHPLMEGHSCTLDLARECSERRLERQEIWMSDLRCRILADNTCDWEFWTAFGHFLFSSSACQRMTGYNPRDFEDDCHLLQRLVHPDDWHKFLGAVEVHRDFVFRLCRRDGEWRWLSHVSQPVYDDDGHFMGTRGRHRDITERRQGEEERARLVAAMEQVAEAILITDVEGHIQFANSAYLDSIGLGLAEVLGRRPQVYRDGETDDLERLITEQLRQGRNWSGPYLKRSCKTGQVTQVESTVSLVRDAQGQPSHCIWVERDVTRERRLEEHLRQSQKLEALATLAGGIAHDFNNQLTSILGSAELLKTRVPPDPEILEATELIECSARRVADMTQKLLGFARQGKHQNVSLSLHQCIRQCLDLARHTFDSHVRVVTDFCPEDPRVMGDPGQIDQVLLNLALNAIEAMTGGGTLTFRTRCCSTASGQLPHAAESVQPPVVALEVTDTGHGIPPELKDRILDPFFTTKKSGAGMGLAMVYGIVHCHGGTIEVQSKVGQGSSFILYLPVAEPAAVPVAPAPRPQLGLA